MCAPGPRPGRSKEKREKGGQKRRARPEPRGKKAGRGTSPLPPPTAGRQGSRWPGRLDSGCLPSSVSSSPQVGLSPRAWIRVSRETELSHSGGLWGEAQSGGVWAAGRRGLDLQALPPLSPWDEARSQHREPQCPHPKSGDNTSTCLGHSTINGSHVGPSSCFCHGPATCRGPILWGGQRHPCQGGAGAGSLGARGGGS